MNLLLDVLRKTEEGQQARGEGPAQTPPAAPRLALEPIAREPRSEAARPTTPDAAHAGTRPAGTRPEESAPPRPAWSLIGGSALASGLLSAAWLWLPAGPSPLAHAGPTLSPTPPASTPADSDTAIGSSTDTEPAAAAVSSSPAHAPPPARRARPHPPGLEAAAPADETVRVRPGSADSAPPRLHVVAAHTAYLAGDLNAARRGYLEALTADPNDADALNGLGAIALREQRPAEAETLFRRTLAVAPDDPTAVAGLSRATSADPLQTETALKNRLAARPGGPGTLALQLALADTLARQRRWAEAQQAWFDAHSLAPDDADIAYNLAVSLDHLGQHRAAAGFYRKALQLAERQAARFSRVQGEARLQRLIAAEPVQ